MAIVFFADEEYKRRAARAKELNGKKTWLVYYTIDPFHRNYYSSYGGFAIAFGNTEKVAQYQFVS